MRLLAPPSVMSDPSAVELEVRRIGALVQARRFPEALAGADRLLTEVPENRDVLYQRALAQRIWVISRRPWPRSPHSEQLYPRFQPPLSGAWATGYVALKQAPQAIEAFPCVP